MGRMVFYIFLPGTVSAFSALLPGNNINIDAQGDIYVADTGNRRIQVLNSNGIYLRKIDLCVLSKVGETFLRLTTPLGLAVDALGRLYVVQSTLNKVSVFTLRDK